MFFIVIDFVLFHRLQTWAFTHFSFVKVNGFNRYVLRYWKDPVAKVLIFFLFTYFRQVKPSHTCFKSILDQAKVIWKLIVVKKKFSSLELNSDSLDNHIMLTISINVIKP